MLSMVGSEVFPAPRLCREQEQRLGSHKMASGTTSWNFNAEAVKVGTVAPAGSLQPGKV